MTNANTADLVGAGRAALQQRHFAEAEQSLALALQCAPPTSELLFLYGTALARNGKRDEAIRFLTGALSLAPDDAAIIGGLAAALRDSGRLDEAERHLRRGLTLHPRSPDLLAGSGEVLRAQGRADQAAECASLALALAPDHAEALALAGFVLRDAGKIAEAISYFERAIAIQPDHAPLHVALAEALLAADRLAEGAAEYEWRWQQAPMPAIPAPLWDGRALGADRTLLLWSDGGVGETVRLIRLARSLRDRVGRVVVAAPLELLRLLAAAPGIDDVVALGGPCPPCDAHLPIGSLPHRLGLRSDAIPADTPYLAVDPAPTDAVAARLAGSGFKVGLALSGEPGRRTPTPGELAPIFAGTNVRFFALDAGAAAAAAAGFGDRITDLSTACIDGANTAAAVARLDLVIAVDAPCAHIAGALGRPGWIMLGRDAHWRWCTERADSPWYPSLLLFRERDAGWTDVAQEIANALALFAASAAPVPTVDRQRAASYAHHFAGADLKIGLALDGDTPLLSDLAPVLAQPGVRFYALDRRTSIQAARDTFGARIGDFAFAEVSPADAAALLSQLDLLIAGDNRTAATAAALGIPVWILAPSDAPAPQARGGAVWHFRREFGEDWSGAVAQVNQALATALSPLPALAG